MIIKLTISINPNLSTFNKIYLKKVKIKKRQYKLLYNFNYTGLQFYFWVTSQSVPPEDRESTALNNASAHIM